MTEIQVDVAALAKLARLDVSKEEMVKLEKDLPTILAFVHTIQSVDVSAAQEDRGLRNVMRADEGPHESGLHTETLLKAAPAREGNRVAVKQVVSRKK